MYFSIERGGLLIDDTLGAKLRAARTERYILQSVAKKALPNERINICLVRSTGDNVAIWSHKTTGRSFYSGLMVCGSVWACPLCAAKIAERRKYEVQTAFKRHQEFGGKIAMLTLTFSHKLRDDLGILLHLFKLASKKFFESRTFRNIRSEMDIIGRIRAFEVTYGVNGYHPHVHIALFYLTEVLLDDVEFILRSKWMRVCEKVGLYTSISHGAYLQSGEEAAQYFSKHGTWSLEQELTKSHIKKAKRDSMTPFDFLRAYIKSEDDKYLFLFSNYFKHFKGKRQLQWSPGLKELYDIANISDEAIAKKKIESADILGAISYEQWKQILKHNARSELLNNTELYGFEAGVELTLNKFC